MFTFIYTSMFGLIIASQQITSALFGYGSFLEKDVILTAKH